MMNMEKINNEVLENVVGGMAHRILMRPWKKDPPFPSMPELGMAPVPFPKKKLMAPTPVIRP